MPIECNLPDKFSSIRSVDKNRRIAIQLLSASVFFSQCRADAQTAETQFGNELRDFQSIGQLAADLYFYAIENDLSSDENLFAYINIDFISRRDTLILVKNLNVPLNNESVFSISVELIEKSRSQYSDNSSAGYNAFLLSELAREAPLSTVVPDSSLVTPIGIPSVLAADRPESNIRVIGDIFIETIGMGISEEGLFISFLESEPGLQLQFEELLSSISSKNWREVAALLEGILLIMLGTSWWMSLREKLGQRLTFALGLRCVPLVGWAYVIGALVVSVKRNYSRFSFERG